ncbi:MAG TPA: metallophosphoesterase, partial [Ornithinibacter sp.]|nr:metallophosphoesterase [Ornithinibacter sp.]
MTDIRTSPASRRQLLTMAAVGGAGLFAAPGAAAATDSPGNGGDPFRITVLGTTDLHGNVLNWDYFKNTEYTDSKANDIGVAKASTIIKTVKAEVGAERTITIDAGDTIQGTPLATYFAKQEPITSVPHIHPMATAMNLIGYDAVTMGNHEFNYGIPFLDTWAKQLHFPALAANAVDVHTGKPYFQPYVIKTMQTKRDGYPLRVGILGLTNPGVAIWDRDNVAGKLRFDDMVATAARWVPVMRANGADVVIVSAHGGDSGTSSYGPELPVENAAALIAQKVPGVDAILFGHAHNDVPQR